MTILWTVLTAVLLFGAVLVVVLYIRFIYELARPALYLPPPIEDNEDD